MKIRDNSEALLGVALKRERDRLTSFGERMVTHMKSTPPSTKGGIGTPYDTGNNARSITFVVTGPLLSVVYGIGLHVYTESGYGGYLELGTKHMPPYPYFRPSFERTLEGFRK